MTRRLASNNVLLIIAAVLVVTGAASAGILYAFWDRAVPLGGMAINYVRYLSAPAGTLVTEMAASKDVESPAAPGAVPAALPIQADVTPTAGALVFFGDMGGNFYAVDATNGQKLWGQKIGGAVGGGVITYRAKETQQVAVATGLTEILWPTEITTAKVSILGLGDATASQ